MSFENNNFSELSPMETEQNQYLEGVREQESQLQAEVINGVNIKPQNQHNIKAPVMASESTRVDQKTKIVATTIGIDKIPKLSGSARQVIDQVLNWGRIAIPDQMKQWQKDGEVIYYNPDRTPKTINEYGQHYQVSKLLDLIQSNYDQVIVTKAIQSGVKGYTADKFYQDYEDHISQIQGLQSYLQKKYPNGKQLLTTWTDYQNEIMQAKKDAGYTDLQREKDDALWYKKYSTRQTQAIEKMLPAGVTLESLQHIIANPESPAQLMETINLFAQIQETIEGIRSQNQPGRLKGFEGYQERVMKITNSKRYGGYAKVQEMSRKIAEYYSSQKGYLKVEYSSGMSGIQFQELITSVPVEVMGNLGSILSSKYLISNPGDKDFPWLGMKTEYLQKQQTQKNTDASSRNKRNVLPTIANARNGANDFFIKGGTSLALTVLDVTGLNDLCDVMRGLSTGTSYQRMLQAKNNVDNLFEISVHSDLSKPMRQDKQTFTQGDWLNVVPRAARTIGQMASLLKTAGILKSTMGQSGGLFTAGMIQSSGQLYIDAKSQGFSKGESLIYSLVVSSAISGLELISPNIGVQKALIGEVAKSASIETARKTLGTIVTKYALNTAWEMSTEVVQEVGQTLTENSINSMANNLFDVKFKDYTSWSEMKEIVLMTLMATGGSVGMIGILQAKGDIHTKQLLENMAELHKKVSLSEITNIYHKNNSEVKKLENTKKTIQSLIVPGLPSHQTQLYQSLVADIDAKLAGQQPISRKGLEVADLVKQQKIEHSKLTDDLAKQLEGKTDISQIDNQTKSDYARVLGITIDSLTLEQLQGIVEVHNMSGGLDTGTSQQNTAKARRLYELGFTDTQIRALMEGGYCGIASLATLVAGYIGRGLVSAATLGANQARKSRSERREERKKNAEEQKKKDEELKNKASMPYSFFSEKPMTVELENQLTGEIRDKIDSAYAEALNYADLQYKTYSLLNDGLIGTVNENKGYELEYKSFYDQVIGILSGKGFEKLCNYLTHLVNGDKNHELYQIATHLDSIKGKKDLDYDSITSLMYEILGVIEIFTSPTRSGGFKWEDLDHLEFCIEFSKSLLIAGALVKKNPPNKIPLLIKKPSDKSNKSTGAIMVNPYESPSVEEVYGSLGKVFQNISYAFSALNNYNKNKSGKYDKVTTDGIVKETTVRKKLEALIALKKLKEKVPGSMWNYTFFPRGTKFGKLNIGGVYGRIRSSRLLIDMIKFNMNNKDLIETKFKESTEYKDLLLANPDFEQTQQYKDILESKQRPDSPESIELYRASEDYKNYINDQKTDLSKYSDETRWSRENIAQLGFASAIFTTTYPRLSVYMPYIEGDIMDMMTKLFYGITIVGGAKIGKSLFTNPSQDGPLRLFNVYLHNIDTVIKSDYGRSISEMKKEMNLQESFGLIVTQYGQPLLACFFVILSIMAGVISRKLAGDEKEKNEKIMKYINNFKNALNEFNEKVLKKYPKGPTASDRENDKELMEEFEKLMNVVSEGKRENVDLSKVPGIEDYQNYLDQYDEEKKSIELEEDKVAQQIGADNKASTVEDINGNGVGYTIDWEGSTKDLGVGSTGLELRSDGHQYTYTVIEETINQDKVTQKRKYGDGSVAIVKFTK